VIFFTDVSEVKHLLNECVIPVMSSFLPEEDLCTLDANAFAREFKEIENALE
jgi:hypothetical protein